MNAKAAVPRQGDRALAGSVSDFLGERGEQGGRGSTRLVAGLGRLVSSLMNDDAGGGDDGETSRGDDGLFFFFFFALPGLSPSPQFPHLQLPHSPTLESGLRPLVSPPPPSWLSDLPQLPKFPRQKAPGKQNPG